jgi:hypothetical protein
MIRSLLSVAAVTSTLFSVAAFTGCVADSGDKTILILNNLVPADSCVIMASEDGIGRSRGRLSVDNNGRYILFPLIKNLAVGDESMLSSRTFFGQGARITLTSPDPAIQTAIGTGAKFTSLSSFSTTPNGGLTATSMEIIPRNVGAAIAAALSETKSSVQVNARVEAFGTMGGSEITSQPFDFPVEVCINCGAIDLGPCAALPMGFQGSAGNPCNSAQDDAVTCCTAPGGAFVCPAAN